MDTATSRSTVLLVIGFLGTFMLMALVGLIYLIDRGTDAALVAVVSTPLGASLGALSAMLVSTRSAPPVPPVPPPGP